MYYRGRDVDINVNKKERKEGSLQGREEKGKTARESQRRK